VSWWFQPLLPAGAALADAGGGTATSTFTASLSLDAWLYKTQTKTTSLDALLLQTGELKTTSLDAELINRICGVVALDSYLSAAQTTTVTKTASLDGLLLQTGELKTSSFDGLLLQTGELKITSLDGLLLQTETLGGDNLDALLLRTGAAKTTSLNAQVGANTVTSSSALTASLDARLAQGFELNTYSAAASLDSILGYRSGALTVSLDGFLFKWSGDTQEGSNTWSARSDAGNRWVAKSTASSGFWDAGGTQSFPDLAMTGVPTVALDAALIYEDILRTADMDSHVVSRPLRTANLDADLSAIARTRDFSADAWLYETLTPTVSLDSLVTGKATVTKTASLDSMVTGETTFVRTFALESYLTGATASTVSTGIDAYLQKPKVFLDARLVPDPTGTGKYVDAFLGADVYKAATDTINFDVLLNKTVSKTAQIHAIVVNRTCGVVALDAKMNSSGAGTMATMSMDSALLVKWCNGVPFDADVRQISGRTAVASMNAVLVGTNVKTTSMNAVVIRAPQFSSAFSSDFDS
jgi:hypothetical protein